MQTLGGDSDDYGNSVQQLSDGGYIVVGTTRSFREGFDDLLLAKWAENGTLSWARTLGGTGGEEGRSVQRTNDGGYIVTGFSSSFGLGTIDLWLIKCTEDGTVSWARILDIMQSTDVGHSVQQTSDGGYIVTGYSDNFANLANADLTLSKWTAAGALSWVQVLAGIDNEYGYSVQQTSDDGYIVTGFTSSSGAGEWDILLSKWTEDGTLSWVQTLGGTGDDMGYSVQQTTDGGYIVTGSTYSFGTDIKTDFWLSKWAADGTLSWVRTLGGSGSDVGNFVQQTTDGGYIVTGYTESFGLGGKDLLLLKWSDQSSLNEIDCISEQSISSAISSISSTMVTATAGNSFVAYQALNVSAHTADPTWVTSCNNNIVSSSASVNKPDFIAVVAGLAVTAALFRNSVSACFWKANQSKRFFQQFDASHDPACVEAGSKLQAQDDEAMQKALGVRATSLKIANK